MFVEKLIERIKDRRSVVSLGLDPRYDQLPKPMKENSYSKKTALLDFNKNLIEYACDLIPVIKLNFAFYVKYDATKQLKETVRYAQKNDLLVILDGKSNDIETSSKAYADAMLNTYGADACTINGYFGYDSIRPYLKKYPHKGIFVVIKTSNASSSDFQDLFSVKLDISDNFVDIGFDEAIKLQNGKKMVLERNYILMAKLVAKWGKYLTRIEEFHNLGGVVGANFPQEIKIVRKISPRSFLLLPGYGFQNANANDIKYAFDENGLGGIVNSGRELMFAYKTNQKYYNDMLGYFGKPTREAIEQMNKTINKVIGL